MEEISCISWKLVHVPNIAKNKPMKLTENENETLTFSIQAKI